jgi:hypothetical protein
VKLRVECYSGGRADERPLRFQIADQWYGPEDLFFKVRASDGNLYILRRRGMGPEPEWTLESFRTSRD